MIIETANDREWQPFTLTITFETQLEARAIKVALERGNANGSATVWDVINAIEQHGPTA